MATGLTIPLSVSRGRLNTDFGVEQARKLIRLALLDGASENPWNSDAGAPSTTFRADSGALRASIEASVKSHFDRWRQQDRMELLSLKWSTVDDGALAVDLEYRDLDTERVESTGPIRI